MTAATSTAMRTAKKEALFMKRHSGGRHCPSTFGLRGPRCIELLDHEGNHQDGEGKEWGNRGRG